MTLPITIADRAAISTLVLEQISGGKTVPAFAELTDCLNEATLVSPADLPRSVARLGSCVRLEWRQTGEAQTVRLVASAEPEAGQISVLTPLGVALLGRSPGDVATVPTLDGPCPVRIADVAQDRPARVQSAPRRATPAGMAATSLLLMLASLLS